MALMRQLLKVRFVSLLAVLCKNAVGLSGDTLIWCHIFADTPYWALLMLIGICWYYPYFSMELKLEFYWHLQISLKKYRVIPCHLVRWTQSQCTHWLQFGLFIKENKPNRRRCPHGHLTTWHEMAQYFLHFHVCVHVSQPICPAATMHWTHRPDFCHGDWSWCKNDYTFFYN